jgi:hypothetical protein
LRSLGALGGRLVADAIGPAHDDRWSACESRCNVLRPGMTFASPSLPRAASTAHRSPLLRLYQPKSHH